MTTEKFEELTNLVEAMEITVTQLESARLWYLWEEFTEYLYIVSEAIECGRKVHLDG